MIRLSLSIALTALVFQANGKLVLDKIGEPLTPDEISKGEAGFLCLKELFGKEGEHVLTQTPSNRFDFHNTKDDEEVEMTDQERYESIFIVFGEEGIDSMCDITRKLRKARLLTPADATDRKAQPSTPERRAQACVASKPLYPAENDIDNAYNDWAAENVDPYLPAGADRNSRTDPNKLITDIQDSIDVVMEAEYAAMACHPIFDGIQAIVSIPDAVVIQQGSIVGGIKQFVCGFGSQVASYATGDLYKKLARARFHDYTIDGVESRASYTNMGNMVNQVCGSSGRLNAAVSELDAIKRKLETRI